MRGTLFLICLLLLPIVAGATPGPPAPSDVEDMLERIFAAGTEGGGAPALQLELKAAVKELYTGDAELGRQKVLKVYTALFRKSRDERADRALTAVSDALFRMQDRRKVLANRLFYQDFEVLDRGVVGGSLAMIDRLRGEFVQAVEDLDRALAAMPPGFTEKTAPYAEALENARDWGRKTRHGGKSILPER